MLSDYSFCFANNIKIVNKSGKIESFYLIKENKQAEQREQEQATQTQSQQFADEFLNKYDYHNDESANFDLEVFKVFSAFFKSSIQSSERDFKLSLDYAVEKVETFTNRTPSQSLPKKANLTEQQIEEQLKRVQQTTPQVANKGTTGNTLLVDINNMIEEKYEQFRDKGGKFDFEI